jgi:DNA-binding IscR family transcriptional regulator
MRGLPGTFTDSLSTSAARYALVNAQEHGVSHITAEKALTKLRDDGLIHFVIGKGYYVNGT